MLVSITNTTFISHQTIPIPQNETEAKELMSQALAKRKSALHKSQLANAALRLCRSRAQHAKQVSDAADTYTAHVRRTIRQSNFSPKYRFTTVREPGVLGVKGMQLFLWNEPD